MRQFQNLTSMRIEQHVRSSNKHRPCTTRDRLMDESINRAYDTLPDQGNPGRPDVLGWCLLYINISIILNVDMDTVN